jgi:hypothetical protein
MTEPVAVFVETIAVLLIKEVPERRGIGGMSGCMNKGRGSGLIFGVVEGVMASGSEKNV